MAINERISADFVTDSYETFAPTTITQTRVSTIVDEPDQFFAPDFLNEVIFANFVDDKYIVFERVSVIQSVTATVLDDSTDTFYNHNLFLSTQFVNVNTVDDSTDNFFAPNFTIINQILANIIDDSIDVFYDSRFTGEGIIVNLLDDSIDTIYNVDTKTRYILGNFARYQEFPLDIFYPIDVDFTQFSQVAKFNDPVEVFYSHLFVPSVLVDILDDSEDDFFNYRINYAHVRSVTVIDDIVDKIYPVSFFGVTLPSVEKNTEFFFELAFDPYPAPIVSSQVVSLTVEPVNFVDSGVTLSNYPKNGSANVSAFISGKYVDLFAEKGEFKYVEQGSSDLLQTPDIVYLMRDIPDGKSIFDFNEFLYDQSDQVDYTFTVDYRLADLPEINADSNLRMVMWLDSTDTDTVVTDSNNVVIEWQDKSTFNHDATSLYNTQETSSIPETKILPDDNAAGDFFGQAIAIGDNRIVITAYGDNFNTGAAYVFDLDGNQIAKITASDGARLDLFGRFERSVAVGNNRIVIGSLGDDDKGSNSGSAYIFDLDGNQIAKITASDGAASDFFGRSVAIGSNRIVVGAYGDDDNGSASGSAYIFDLNGNQLAKIKPNDGTALDSFGWYVAIGNDRIIVSSRSSAVYIFDLNGNQLKKIVSDDDEAPWDFFADAIAIGNDRIVVGAPGDELTTGAAYIFDLDGNKLAKITASDGSYNDYFGESIAIGDNKIVVGAPPDDSEDDVTDTGSAYIFDLDGNQLAKITASDAAELDFFGTSVAIGSNRIVVGSVGDDDNGSGSGSAYIYSFESPVSESGQPQIYYDGIMNGLPAVRHHYTDTVSHTLVSDLELTDGVTIFVVTKNNIDANSFIVMGSYIDTSNNESFTNADNYGYMGYQEVSNNTDPINQNNPVINYYVNDYLIDPESPAELYQSVVDNNSNIQIYTFTIDSFETLSTGLLDLGTDLNVEKDIGEVIVYDAIIPKEDVRKIHAYLANKWGIANTKIMTEINKKYGDVTYSVTDSCGGVQTFDSSIYTYSLTLNHIVTNRDDSQGTEYLDNYLKDYAKRPDC